MRRLKTQTSSVLTFPNLSQLHGSAPRPSCQPETCVGSNPEEWHSLLLHPPTSRRRLIRFCPPTSAENDPPPPPPPRGPRGSAHHRKPSAREQNTQKPIYAAPGTRPPRSTPRVEFPHPHAPLVRGHRRAALDLSRGGQQAAGQRSRRRRHTSRGSAALALAGRAHFLPAAAAAALSRASAMSLKRFQRMLNIRPLMPFEMILVPSLAKGANARAHTHAHARHFLVAPRDAHHWAGWHPPK